MLDAPRHDWSLYESLTAPVEAARHARLETGERYDLYADLFAVIWQCPRSIDEQQRLDQLRWRQKLASRMRAVEAYASLDKLRERTAQQNAP